jgi:hypothetical protein
MDGHDQNIFIHLPKMPQKLKYNTDFREVQEQEHDDEINVLTVLRILYGFKI